MTVPRAADDLTSAWLTEVLQERHPGCTVAGVEFERLGGLSSTVHRVRLAYAPGGPAGPPSVIVKTALPGTGVIGRDAFDREMRFYRELAPRVPVAVPAVYYADIDSETGAFALVLEDFPGHSAWHEDAIATEQQARRIAGAMARLHAAWWGDDSLAEHGYLRDLPEFIGRVEAQLVEAHPRFMERYGDVLTEAGRSALVGVARSFRETVEPLLEAPRTLVHHDLSLRNVLLGDAAGERDVVFIDWQLAQHNAGVRDLSYFLGTTVADPGLGRSLRRYYWEALRDEGVHGYDYPRLEADYDRSVICDLGRMVMTGGHAEIAAGMDAVVWHQLRCRGLIEAASADA